jgi:hypothetical protein
MEVINAYYLFVKMALVTTKMIGALTCILLTQYPVFLIAIIIFSLGTKMGGKTFLIFTESKL